MIRFDDKIVAVTGGGRGIGRNVCEKFRALGATVVSFDRKNKEFNDDLSVRYASLNLIEEIYEKYGRLDVLVNNARSHLRGSLGDETEAEWDEEIAVGLRTPYFLGKYMIERDESGSIVNIGSVTTNFVSHETAGYQVSKGGCLSLTRALAKLGAPKVTCNAVLPGFIVQDEHRERYEREDNLEYRETMEGLHPMKRIGTSDDIASAVVCLASLPFVTGTSLVVDGGLTMQEMASEAFVCRR